MPWKTARCAACEQEVPLPKLERLLWVVVCRDCARSLSGRGALRWFRRTVVPFLFYAGLAGCAWFGGPGLRALLGGAASADLITWLVFGFFTAMFEGVELLVALAFRTAGLALVLGPGLPIFPEGPYLAPATIAFFVVLIAKTAWLAARFDGLVDDDADDAGEEEEFDPLGTPKQVALDADPAPPTEPLHETRRAG